MQYSIVDRTLSVLSDKQLLYSSPSPNATIIKLGGIVSNKDGTHLYVAFEEKNGINESFARILGYSVENWPFLEALNITYSEKMNAGS